MTSIEELVERVSLELLSHYDGLYRSIRLPLPVSLAYPFWARHFRDAWPDYTINDATIHGHGPVTIVTVLNQPASSRAVGPELMDAR
jgi:hypothetical protein